MKTPLPFGNFLRSSRKAALPALMLILAGFQHAGAQDQVTVVLDAGGGAFPFFSPSNGTATNGLTLQIGTFNSASDADVQALGYNLLWVNNQFTIMTPSAGNTTTSSINSQNGSFSSDGSIDANWSTSSSAALNRSIWLAVSDSTLLSSAAQYGLHSSSDSAWDMPATYSGNVLRELDTGQITLSAYGSTNGTASTSSVRLAARPSTYLYWDSNNAAGLGGDGAWSSSLSDTEWTTESGGVATDGAFAWGSTSGTTFYAGAGLTAYFGGTAGTVTVSGSVETLGGIEVATTGYIISSGTISLSGSNATSNTINITTGSTTISSVLSGTNGMTKSGSGTLTLSGANSFTGGVTLNAGTLGLSGGSAIADGTSISLADGSGAVLNIVSSETIGSLSGGGSTGGNISIAASQTLTVNQTSNGTFAGSMSGSGAFTKNGSSTLIFSGSNSYSGATTINAGILRATNSNALGSTAGNTTVSSGAALELSGGISIGAEPVILNGSGIDSNGALRNISGDNSLSGVVTLASASTIGSDAGTLTLTGGITGTNTNVVFAGSGNTTISTSGITTGSGTLTKNGNGTLTLSATNTYSGATTINSGTLLLTGTAANTAISIASSGTLAGTGSAGSTTVQNGGRIAPGTTDGSIGNLAVSGLTLQGGGGYNWNISNVTGTPGTNWDLITVGGGTTDATISATSGSKFTIYIAGNPTGWDPSASYNWNIIDWGAGTTFDATAFAIDSSGFTGTTPSGTWTLASTGGFLNLAYSFAGDPVWSGGTGNWNAGFSPAIADNQTPAIIFAGAGGTATNNISSAAVNSLASITFNSTAGAYTLAANSGSAGFNTANPIQLRGGIVNNSTSTQTIALALTINGTRTIDTASGAISISGAVSGSGGLTKNGSSTLTLSGANTYTGTTTINAGNLTLSGGSAIANNGAITLANAAGAVLHIAASETIGNLSGGGATGGNVSLASGQTLTVNQTSGTTFSGIVLGSGALAKTGNSTLILAGANTYSGGTTLSAGAIRIDHADALGTSGNITFSGGTLQYGSGISADVSSRIKNSGSAVIIDTNSQSVTFGSAIDSTNSGGLSKDGAGTLTLSGANTYTGTTTINAGNLTVSGGSAISDSGAVTFANTSGAVLHIAASETIGSISGGGSTGGNISLAASQTLTVNQTSAASYNGSLTGAGGFTKNGSSTLTLTGTQTFTGATTINAGTLALSGANLLPATANVTISAPGTLQFASGNQAIGSIAGAGTINLGTHTLSTGNFSSTFSGNITGDGGLTKIGSGALTLSGTNSFLGTTTISTGTLILSTASALRTDSVVTLASGATLTVNANTVVGSFENNGGTLNGGGSLVSAFTLTQSGTLSAVIADGTVPFAFAAGIRKTTSGTSTINAANTYTGLTRIEGGTLVLGASGSFSASSNLFTLAGATLDLANKSQAFASINGTGGTISLGSGTLTVNGSANSNTAAAITGSGGVTKAGSGSLTLNASNTYTGTTAINAGVLRAEHANSLGSTAGGTTVASGAALELIGGITVGAESLGLSGSGISNDGALRNISGDNTWQGAVTLNAASRIQSDAGNLTLSGGISGTQNLTFGGDGNISVGGVIATSTGTLTKEGSGTLTLAASNSYSGATTINSGTVVLSGSIASSAITVNSGGTLSGSGTGGALTINSGGTINPGNSPGTLTVGSTTWNGGGHYNWQIYDASSTAGTGWDLLSSSGTLTIGATSGDRFNINLWSLSSISPDSNGTPINFDAASSQSWTIASFASVSGFSEDKFTINTSANNGAGGFSGDAGTFSLSLSGGNLSLVYTATPPTPPTETVTITTTYGGDIDDWVFADTSGTATNGYTVRIAAFDQSQSEVLAMSYNREWLEEQMLLFGSNTTATQGTTNTVGSLVRTITSEDETLHGKQAWVIYSNNATLTGSNLFGIVSSSNASYIIPSANPWATTLSGQYLQTSEGGVVGFGSVNATNSTAGTIRVGSLPVSLYWDSNGAAGLGGSGTWGGNISQTGWTTNASGLAASGIYAWGSTSGNVTAGAGLAAVFGGTAGTVTVSGTVQTYSGLSFEAGGYTLTGGAISLAGATGSENTITVSTGTATINSALEGTNGLTKAGAGTLRLGGTNTFSGGTTLSTGTLRITSSGALGSGSLTQTDGTSVFTIDTTGTVANSMSLYNVVALQSATLNGTITVNNAVFDVDSGDTLTISGGVGGSGGVTKNGTGTLVLSGSNTFSGATVVNAGTLNAANASALGTSSTITVNGGSLLVSANGSIADNASISLGSGTGAGGLVFSGNIGEVVGALTLTSNSVIDMGSGAAWISFDSLFTPLAADRQLQIWNYTPGSDAIYFRSSTNVQDSLAYISFYSGAGTGTFFNAFNTASFSPPELYPTPVPEPETYATALLLLLGLGLYFHRQRKAVRSAQLATNLTRPGE